MKHFFYILLLFAATAFITNAQVKSIDDYKKILQTPNTDSLQIDALVKLSLELVRNKPREMLPFAQIIKEKGDNNNNKILQENGCHQMALAYNNLRLYDSALLFFRKALDANSATKDIELRGVITNDLGYSFYQQNILDSSLIYYHKAFEIKKQVGKPKPIAATLNGIGLVYRTRNNITAAYSYYKEALTIYESLGDKAALSVMSNIATLYNLQKKYDSATAIFKKIYSSAATFKDENMMFNAQVNLALALNYQEKFAEALPTFQELVNNPRVKQLEDINNAVQYGLGQSYMGIKDYAKAIPILKNCLTLRFRNTKYQSLAAITNLLYIAEKEQKNYQQALEYYLLVKSYNDSLLNSSRTALIEELDTKYKTAQKEHQIILLDKDNKLKDISLKQEQQNLLLAQIKNNERQQQIELLNKNNEVKDLSIKEQQQYLQLQKNQNIEKEQQIALLNKDNEVKNLLLKESKRTQLLYTLGLSLLAIAVVSALVLFSIKQRANKQLAEKNKIISKSLHDKEVLLKEIHHRVKNNLQVVSSLLNLQSRNIKDVQAQAAIKEGRDRVKSMAIIHENLYQEDNLTGVDMKNYIEKLTENLFVSYNIAHGSIQLQTDIDAMQLDVDTVIPIGLILNELISNALKYAFTENETGILSVTLKQQNNDLLLAVKDNGKGLPEGWDINQLNSLGFQIIKSFAQKLKAALMVHNNNGTEVQMLISKYTTAI